MRKVEIKHLGTIRHGTLSRYSIEVVTDVEVGKVPNNFVQHQEYIADLDSGEVIKNKFTGNTEKLVDEELKQMFFAQPLRAWDAPPTFRGLSD